MTRWRTTLIAFAVATSLSGCMASAALDAVTAPVRVAGRAVDLATTSQSEADERRGRELRQREERLGKLQRAYRNHAQQCADGDDDACDKRDADRAQIQRILPTVPVEPEY